MRGFRQILVPFLGSFFFFSFFFIFSSFRNTEKRLFTIGLIIKYVSRIFFALKFFKQLGNKSWVDFLKLNVHILLPNQVPSRSKVYRPFGSRTLENENSSLQKSGFFAPIYCDHLGFVPNVMNNKVYLTKNLWSQEFDDIAWELEIMVSGIWWIFCLLFCMVSVDNEKSCFWFSLLGITQCVQKEIFN